MITEIHVWMQNRRKSWTEPEVINGQSGRSQPGKRVVLEVEPDTSIAEMKIAIAEVLDKYKKDLLYYYIVAASRRKTGPGKRDFEMGYKTIVGKVYPKRDKSRKQ